MAVRGAVGLADVGAVPYVEREGETGWIFACDLERSTGEGAERSWRSTPPLWGGWSVDGASGGVSMGGGREDGRVASRGFSGGGGSGLDAADGQKGGGGEGEGAVHVDGYAWGGGPIPGGRGGSRRARGVQVVVITKEYCVGGDLAGANEFFSMEDVDRLGGGSYKSPPAQETKRFRRALGSIPFAEKRISAGTGNK